MKTATRTKKKTESAGAVSMRELIAQTAERGGGEISGRQAHKIITAFIETVSENIVAGKRVRIPRLVAMEKKKMQGRSRVLDPQGTGKEYRVPAYTKVSFKTSDKLRDRLNKRRAKQPA